MKKRILTGLLVGAMTLALAGTAMAAQAFYGGTTESNYEEGTVAYRSTTAVVGGKTLETNNLARGVKDNQFKNDGTTNYPYEIYLPNEASPANYRIHTNYTKNTDACAACHATHTAVGSSLLQWYTVYDACMACHDGTVTTTYNVQEGEIGVTGTAAFGGMFGNGTQGSLSTHNVTGAMEIAAAPGGSVVGETVPAGANKHEVTRWATEFGCESCHTPHGQGGNARILHPDANGTATKMAQGKKFTASANADGSWSVKPALDDEEAAVNAVYNGYYFLNGYPYSLKVVVDNVEKKFGYTVDNKSGYTKVTIPGTTVASNVYFEGVPSLKVTMQIADYLKDTEDVKHQSGMNLFCGACHTDYNTAVASQFEGDGEFAGSGSAETGVYSKAHRHQVGFQWHGDVAGLKFEVGQKGEGAVRTPYVNETNYGMECLTCHVAHGTSEDYWKTTLVDTNIWASTMDLKEIAGSSALKRMPNMGTCEACHAKGAGNQGYSANTAQADVAPIKGVADQLNYSVANIAYNGNYSVQVGGKKQYLANFLTKFFTDEPYTGSAACEACHKEYYEGWSEEGHSRSFTKVTDPSNTWFVNEFKKFRGRTFASGTVPYTYANTSTGVKVTGYVTGSFSFTDEENPKLTWTVGGSTYSYGAADVDYLWVDHYVGSFSNKTTGAFNRKLYIYDGNDDTYPKVLPMIKRNANTIDPPSFTGLYQGDVPTADNFYNCVSCHAPGVVNQAEGFANTMGNFKKGTPDTTIGCETCHGPGTRHVSAPSSKNIFNAEALSDKELQQNFCATCHSGNHYVIDSVGFKSTKHYQAGIGCTSCHDVHITKKADGQHSALRTTKDQLCATCHDKAIDIETYMTPDKHYGTETLYTNHMFTKPIN